MGKILPPFGQRDKRNQRGEPFVELGGVARAVAKIHAPRQRGVHAVSAVIQPRHKAACAPNHQPKQNRRNKIVARARGDAADFLADFHAQPAAQQTAHHALPRHRRQPKPLGVAVRPSPVFGELQNRHQLVADARAQQAKSQHPNAAFAGERGGMSAAFADAVVEHKTAA